MKLSIIIPCYNCEKTLEEAVVSCYKKPFDFTFEIIMVDDGSTDGTKNLIHKIQNKYPKIKSIFHEYNKVGGSTRNTGIEASNGEYIFCLDSDNILDVDSINNMVLFMAKKDLDGVAFHDRRFFHSDNKNNYTSHFNPIKEEAYTLKNLFDGSGIILDNFIYSKKSFLRTMGYPTHHGFDTQCFEMRFLHAGNTVASCPNSFFYHRQNNKEPSYFEREFNKGNFSVNYYLSMEDIWSVLSNTAKEKILNYDIFKKSSLSENIMNELISLCKNNKMFSMDCKTETESDLCMDYNFFIKEYQNKNYKNSLEITLKILQTKFPTSQSI